MEPWGFEPQIQPCHGRVIPFHYGPDKSKDSLEWKRVKVLADERRVANSRRNGSGWHGDFSDVARPGRLGDKTVVLVMRRLQQRSGLDGPAAADVETLDDDVGVVG